MSTGASRSADGRDASGTHFTNEGLSPGGARRRRFADGRWHFQHGPIDCVIGADGDRNAIDGAVERAWVRFGGVLGELVAELPWLRTDLASPEGVGVAPKGSIALRMVAACRAHAADGRFITAMAAVAGSVAEELIAVFDDPRIVRAYVNNGGDIALHLGAGASFEIGIVANPERARGGSAPDGRFRIDAASGVRGIATSGWRGRSLSLGIADSVTVLAATASAADAAATVIANAVDADDPRIRRAPARSVRDDSDLGERLVTRDVPVLDATTIARALAAGAAEAQVQIDAGRACAAALCLQGQVRTCEEGAAFGTLANGCHEARRPAEASRAATLRPLAPPSMRM